MKRHAAAIVLALGVGTAATAAVADHCATLLGSIGVELRHARQLPRGTRTTFTCPRDTRPLLEADRRRVLSALGPPDVAAPIPDGQGLRWTYRFGPEPGDDADRPAGEPELHFDFGPRFAILAVVCQRRR